MEIGQLCIEWNWKHVNRAAATFPGNSSNLWNDAEWVCMVCKISEQILEA